MNYPEQEPRFAELLPAASVFCVLRPGCELYELPESRPSVLPHNNARFFLLLYHWISSFNSRKGGFNGRGSMNSQCYTVAMDLGVCQLRNFSISFLSSVLGKESASVRLDNSSSGASVVAIDNKIEQAMDLVKSHLMYAVREEVEVLKEQIKELIERNTQLEQENNLLKTLASPEQMAQFQAQVQTGSPTGNAQPLVPPPTGTTQALPSSQSSGTSA
ncbi:TSC22 domain family protein 1 isoform X1 [Labrus mixtus]|uniref:TSC22 domain family protein 1 isoform X1 n=1 Tax=Labrus mixtus TaxID=508554 RepID=UPI0029BFDD8E|nr:TSC22 domain family protein 1 isoform X1 [Labrus mixtus]